MPPDREGLVERVRAVSAEEVDALVHDADEALLAVLPECPHFQEKHAEILLDRLDISSAIISALADKTSFLASEAIRLRIARHPHSPRRLALAALRQLFLFDLLRVTLLPSAPPDIRRAAEDLILARIPHLPLGEKLTLARRATARVAGALLAEGHPQALKIALANPLLTESQVLKVLALADIKKRVVSAIAAHDRWASRYNVRAALLRNPHTPGEFRQLALDGLTQQDLVELSGLREISGQAREAIDGELVRRRATRSGKDFPSELPGEEKGG